MHFRVADIRGRKARDRTETEPGQGDEAVVAPDRHVITMIMILSCDANKGRHYLMPIESRTARLTILIDPRKKAVFERLCADEDATPSQVVRRLMRDYIEQRTGRPWHPEDDPASVMPSSPPMAVHARAR